MTQIKIFNETTFHGTKSPDAPTIETLTQRVNEFLAENDGKITVKDIRYTILSPNPRNISIKDWTIMVIYETQLAQ